MSRDNPRDNCKEFPYLSDEAIAAYRAAFPYAVDPFMDHDNRRNLSAFLQEAMKQAHLAWINGKNTAMQDELEAIANNLHNPPPPPPTREQMEQALQSLIDEYGARVAGEWTDAHLQTLSAGIAHYCFVVR